MFSQTSFLLWTDAKGGIIAQSSLAILQMVQRVKHLALYVMPGLDLPDPERFDTVLHTGDISLSRLFILGFVCFIVD